MMGSVLLLGGAVVLLIRKADPQRGVDPHDG